jgi:hypothetical protein
MPSSKGPTDNRRAAARTMADPTDPDAWAARHFVRSVPTTYDTPEAEALAKALSENRCGDKVCEELRFRAALDVLTGRGRKAHNGNAIALFAINEPNENPEPKPMTTHDTPEAALAAALHRELDDDLCVIRPNDDAPREHDMPDEWWGKRAAAILAALDGWTLIDDEYLTGTAMALADEIGRAESAEAEIARLRAAGEALWAALWSIDLEDGNARARTAMDGWRHVAPSEP